MADMTKNVIIQILQILYYLISTLVSAYLMTERILEPDLPEKPFLHVCTEAIICPFYRILGGLTAIIVQLIGSGKISGQNITDTTGCLILECPFTNIYLALLSTGCHCISICKISYFNIYFFAIFFKRLPFLQKYINTLRVFFSFKKIPIFNSRSYFKKHFAI